MDLVNKQVIHKSFGKGSIVKHEDSYIAVDFPSGIKKFVYPDAFSKYLTFTDEKAAQVVEQRIKKSQEQEKEQKKLKIKQREKRRSLRERQRLARIQRSRRVHPSSQVVFWVKDEELGEIFTDWEISTGVIKSGQKKGQPRRLARVNQNSACLLTSRSADMDEEDRYILGIFLVKELFIGRLNEDGIIPAHPEYRIRLTPEESKKMLFWNYYLNKRYPHRMTWNTGRSRYLENIWLAQILRDLIHLRKGTEGEEKTKLFFEHFCKLNHIVEEELPQPEGALIRV